MDLATFISNVGHFFGSALDSVSKGFSAIAEISPMVETIAGYMPTVFGFAISTVFSYALLKFVLSFF